MSKTGKPKESKPAVASGKSPAKKSTASKTVATKIAAKKTSMKAPATFTVDQIMQRLEKLGTAQTRKTWTRHGGTPPLFGVKIGDMKPLQKLIKKDYELSKSLYATNNLDAMYLAGLIADETRMTKQDLDKWAKLARWYMISEYTVAGVAAESPFAWHVANKWIKSKQRQVAAAGWATLAAFVSITNDEDLPIGEIDRLLRYIGGTIHDQSRRVKYTMNGFVIAVGCYVNALTKVALQTAAQIGTLEIDMGDTACKVPDAASYIHKVKSAGRLGKKRTTARC